jgi:HEAT repeat protein
VDAAARATEGSGQRRQAGTGSGAVETGGEGFRRFFEEFDRLDPVAREVACATLSRVDPELDAELTEVLTSVEGGVRLRAVKIVAALSREREVEETLLELVGDPDERVRSTVVKTLAALNSEPAVRALLEAVTDFDRRVVANAVETIEAGGYSELLGLVRILAGHANNRIRANAVKTLIKAGSPGAGQMLEEMLASPAEMMRLSATWVLGEVVRQSGGGREYPGGLERLRSMAQGDPSARVRERARGILGEIG